jgi:hypothetical protein
MKMNINLIRDILLQSEINKFIFPKFEESIYKRPELEFLDKYTISEVVYHLKIIEQEKLLQMSFYRNSIEVKDLTAKGHFFLLEIRDNSVWEKTLNISKKIGVSSLTALKDIAVQVSSSLIVNYFK